VVHGGLTYVSAFDVDPAGGELRLLNRQPCSGSNPVDAALDATSRFLVVANYSSGNVTVLPLGADGSLQPVSQLFELTGTSGPDPVQQSSSHPHAVIFDPSRQFVIVPDKGFDRTFIFRFDLLDMPSVPAIRSHRGVQLVVHIEHRLHPVKDAMPWRSAGRDGIAWFSAILPSSRWSARCRQDGAGRTLRPKSGSHRMGGSSMCRTAGTTA
jgi:hypothetical protein